MFEKLSRYVLHPFFMAAYPILFLLSFNAGQIPVQQAGRILPASLLAALALTLAFGLLAGSLQRGGFVATLFLALFFSYGHVYNWFEKSVPFLASQTVLTVVWGALLLAGIWAAYKARNPDPATKYLNLVLLFLLIQPTAAVGLSVYRSGIRGGEADPLREVEAASQEDLPDIYYIILDGYGRSDTLRELYDYDNSSFINDLRQRGFYVAEQSHSNYAQTALSLASSLNFNYLNLKDMDTQSADRAQLIGWIRRSKLRGFLRERGYQTVAFSTGYDLTTLDRSDIFFPLEDASGFNTFEGLVFSTSLVRALDPEIQEEWFIDPFRCDNHRRYVLNIFEKLEKTPEIPGSKFVFAHIISPHPPFIFGSEENEGRTSCNLLDGDSYTGEASDYQRGYAAQAEYINTLTLDAVDAILEKSKIPPVIIIQGDHGPGMLLDWSSAEGSCLRERFSVLNAYHLPFDGESQLYESITPVNSFRVTLNGIFNSQMPLLEDRSYYSPWEAPYQVEDVTDRLGAACK